MGTLYLFLQQLSAHLVDEFGQQIPLWSPQCGGTTLKREAARDAKPPRPTLSNENINFSKQEILSVNYQYVTFNAFDIYISLSKWEQARRPSARVVSSILFWCDHSVRGT